MKHSIIIFLSIAVTLATASCSKSDKNTEDSATASVEAVSSAAPAEQEETSSVQNAETSAAEQSQPAEEVTQAKVDDTFKIFNDGIATFKACKSANDVYKALKAWMSKGDQVNAIMTKLKGKDLEKAQRLSNEVGQLIQEKTKKYNCSQEKLDEIMSGM